MLISQVLLWLKFLIFTKVRRGTAVVVPLLPFIIHNILMWVVARGVPVFTADRVLSVLRQVANFCIWIVFNWKAPGVIIACFFAIVQADYTLLIDFVVVFDAAFFPSRKISMIFILWCCKNSLFLGCCINNKACLKILWWKFLGLKWH